MATGRKMETLGDLQRFKESMLANVDKLVPYEESRAKFDGLVSKAQELNREQAALTAAKQDASRQFDEALREAQRLATVLRFVVYPGRLLGMVQAPVRHWVLSIASFEMLQYALWVACDLLILAGVEWALVLRIAPNTLYYALFLPFVVLRAPEAAWVPSAGRMSRPG